MASPTKAEVWSLIQNYVSLIDSYSNYSNANSPNYIGKEDALIGVLKGETSSEITTYLQGFRREINARVSGFGSVLQSLFMQLAKFGYNINTNGLTIQEVMIEISRSMDGSETIKNRSMTYGSISVGGSNVGTAYVYRTKKDEHGQNLEIAQSGTIVAEVIKDKNNGSTPGGELIRLRGSGKTSIDEIELLDSTDSFAEYPLVDSGRSLLKDGAFNTIERASTITKDEQTNWTLSDRTKFEISTSSFFRYRTGEENKVNGGGCSLVAKAGTDDVWFAQYVARQRIVVAKNTPYLLGVRIMVDSGSADGTVTLRLGSQTVTKDISELTANQWFTLVIGEDEKGYYENFKENWVSSDNQDLGVRARVDVTGRTASEKVFFSSMFLVKGNLFNGVYYFLVAGQNTSGNKDALVGDKYTFADSASNTGRIQTMVSRYLRHSLPHTSGTPTYADV